MNNATKKIRLRISFDFRRNLTIRTVKFVFLILFWLISFSLYSQPFFISRASTDYPESVPTSECSAEPFTNCVIKLLPGQAGTDYVFNVVLNTANPFSHEATFVEEPCTCSSNPSTSYTANNLFLTVTVPGSCICSSDPGYPNNYIDVNVHVDYDGPMDDQVFRIPLPRNPLRIALVLDISGSMSLPTPGNNVDFTPRWDVLKTAVKTFTEKFEFFRYPFDSLALTYFSTTTEQPVFPTTDGFIEITPENETPATNLSSAIISTDLNLSTRFPHGRTAMGLGLMDGKTKLRDNNITSDGAKKIVLLFTDGFQNVYPKVTTDGVTLEDGRKLNECNPCTGLQQLIKYYTISMGVGLDVPEILTTIADNNDGKARNSTTGEPTEFTTFFDNQWENMLYSSSPQTVANKTGTSISDEADFSFLINKNIKTVLLQLVSKESDSLTINVVKDGITLTPVLERYDSNHKLAGFNLPYLSEGNAIFSSGKWDVYLKGNSDKKYILSCFVDDHFLKYNFELNKSIFTVGDSIMFSGKLDYAGEPLADENIQVEAVIFKPGDDIGNLLSSYLTPDTIQYNDVDDPAQQKLQALLLNDSSFYHSLLPEEQIVELKQENPGSFSGSFSSTELCGVYKIVYLLKGDIPRNGSFERSRTSEAFFVFGNVEETDPVVNPKQPQPLPDSSKYKNLTVLQVSPKNKFGYLMGPGFSSKINVVINPGKRIHSASLLPVKEGEATTIVKEIKDNLDGSYLIFLASSSKNSNPKISISVRGETMYEGRACPLPWWVNLLLIILAILLVLLYFFKSKNLAIYKIILWIFSIIVVIIILLHYFGIIRLFC